MYISRKKRASYFLLFSILGVQFTDATMNNRGYKQYPLPEDGFGVTNYGFQCSKRIHLKHSVFAAAKHYCDGVNKGYHSARVSCQDAGFRTVFPSDTEGEIIHPFRPLHHLFILPILEDGTLYQYAKSSFLHNKKPPPETSHKDSVKMDPGPDRLIIDQNCDILGAFIELDYPENHFEGRIEGCKLLKTPADVNILSFSSSDSYKFSSSESSPRSTGDYSLPGTPRISFHTSSQDSPRRSRHRSPYVSSPRFSEQLLDQPHEINA
ncbi:hypothetical protein HI914_06455 [Erysiphe necator]|nr:hypothetical protein HI914_06455 [Erysiphe necator]